MTNLSHSSSQKKISNRILAAFLILGFIGFLDATYLAVEHYRGVPVACSILEGCEIVTTSSYAAIGPVSVALLGSLYYLAIFLLAMAYADTGRVKILQFLSWFTAVGFLVSLWFVSLQLFVIKAACIYCLGSALTSTVIFVLGMYCISASRKNNYG